MENKISDGCAAVTVEQPDKVRKCCHIDCEAAAKFTVQYSKHYEDYADFCAAHIARYLPSDREVVVSPILPDEDNLS